MNIYVQDNGRFGNIVVIANSENDAREMMRPFYNYYPDEELYELPIELGVVTFNYGEGLQ